MRSDVTEMIDNSALEDFEKNNIFDLNYRRSDKNFKYFLKIAILALKCYGVSVLETTEQSWCSS